MTGRIDFLNLVRQLLPPHKRQPVRLWLLRSFVWPLESLFRDTDDWRTRIRLELNVTSQILILEGYLQRKYNEPLRIRLLSFADKTVKVGLFEEGRTHRLRTGTKEDNSSAVVPLYGEIRETFGDADFIVYIPPGVEIESVRADIERFKQALIKYRIIQE